MSLHKNTVEKIDNILDAVWKDGRNMLFEHESYQLLDAIGIDVPKYVYVRSESDLEKSVAALRKLDSKQLVAKIVSRDIQHKTDVGGVAFFPNEDGRCAAQFRELNKHVAAKAPKAKLEGVLFMECLQIEIELLLSLMSDPQFGHALTLGMGGTLTELIKDAVFRLAPMDDADLKLMPPELKFYKLLTGYRGKKAVDQEKIFATLGAMNSLSASCGFVGNSRYLIEDFEINPLVVTKDGRLCAIDSILRFKPREEKSEKKRDFFRSLRHIFNAKRVAVVGASEQEGSVGNGIMINVMKSSAEIIPINPKRETLFGLKCYKSVSDIPGEVDVAILAIAAKYTLDTVKKCVEKKIPSIILITSGFGEMGEEGKNTEKQLYEILSNSESRAIGPNCLGIYNAANKFSSFFLNPKHFHIREIPTFKTDVTMLSQSGAISCTLVEVMRNVGVGKLVSFGNMLDIDVADFIAYMDQDQETKVIGVYVEGLKRGRHFYETLKKTSKPVVVLKGGKSAEGSKATMTHTGAIAGDVQILQSAIWQANAIEAKNIMQLEDFIKAFTYLREKKVYGNRVGILGNGGGIGVVSADEIPHTNMQLAQFSTATVTRLKQFVGEYVQVNNPTDIGGGSTDEDMIGCLEAILEDDGVDVVIFLPGLEPVAINDERLIANLMKVSKKYDKPILVSFSYFYPRYELIDRLEQEGLAIYPFPERAVQAMNAFVTYNLRKQGEKIIPRKS